MRWFFLTILAFLIALFLVGTTFHYLLFSEPTPDPTYFPRSGEVVNDPSTGERFEFRKTSVETDGKLVEMELTLQPGGRQDLHAHAGEDVTIRSQSRTFIVVVDGEEHDLGVGDTLVIARGKMHQALNPTDRVVRAAIEVHPGGDFDVFLVQFHGFMNAEGPPKTDEDVFWQMILFGNRYGVYRDGPPLFVQKVVGFVLAPAARVMQYQSFYPGLTVAGRVKQREAAPTSR